MEILKHKNLLIENDHAETYSVFQKDYDWDSKLQSLWHLVFFVCAAGAAYFAHHVDWLWLFGGLYAIERAIGRYIENSNRNWAMHVIDWVESKQSPGAI